MRRRIRALFTWQVAAPIVAYTLSALLVVSVLDAFVARHEAIDARNKTAATDAEQIDRLNSEITRLQHRVTNDARERGRLEEAIKILAEQVRRMGGRPVETTSDGGGASSASTVTPRPSSTPTSTHSPPQPHPHPSPSPTPSPSPSPSCDLTHPLHCLPV